MTMLLAPLRWDRPPPYPVPVDPTHPIVRGRPVRMYYPPAGPELLVPSGGPSILDSVAPNARGGYSYGTKYFSSATTGSKFWQCAAGPILSGHALWSVFVICRQTQGERSGGYWAYQERAATGNDIIGIGARNNGAGGASNNVLMTVRDDAGNLIQLPANFSVIDGNHHALCGVRYGATDHRFYVDGFFSFTSATNVTNTYTNAVTSNIGWDPATPIAWGDEIKCVILFPGIALSQPEVIELTMNPWQILMPQTYPVWPPASIAASAGSSRWFFGA